MAGFDRAGTARLENYANNSSQDHLEHGGRRRSRYERRRLLWAESVLERVRKCGRVRRGEGVVVRYREGSGAGFAGLVTCGSVWAEPVCNAKIMARRAVEIGGAIAVWQMAGKSAAFVTLTMRHHEGQRLADLWAGLTKAWGRVTSGRGWVEDCAAAGVAGWCRVVEVTIGRNGWHVHTHVVLFLEVEPDPLDLAQLHARMFARWRSSLVEAGFGVPLAAGQDCHLVSGPADESLAAYFTKAVDHGHRIGLEFTQSQTKGARDGLGTVPAWRLLDRVQDGDADALDLWHEYERASRGKRQISWARGMRERLGLMREQSDEQIAAEEVGSSNDDLVLITNDGWRVLLGLPHVSLADVLTVTESLGLAGLRGLLDSFDVEYLVLGGVEHAA